jgi:hypothetical protein
MKAGAPNRAVRELCACLGHSQKQTAPAHVATADEVERKLQALSEDVEENLHIFW